jgi:hypothetical protein
MCFEIFDKIMPYTKSHDEEWDNIVIQNKNKIAHEIDLCNKYIDKITSFEQLNDENINNIHNMSGVNKLYIIIALNKVFGILLTNLETDEII